MHYTQPLISNTIVKIDLSDFTTASVSYSYAFHAAIGDIYDNFRSYYFLLLSGPVLSLFYQIYEIGTRTLRGPRASGDRVMHLKTSVI